MERTSPWNRPKRDPDPTARIDAPDADTAEQDQPWSDEEDEPRTRHPSLPPDAPEADFWDQQRSAGLDEDDRARE